MDEAKTGGTLSAIYSPKELKGFFQNYLLILSLLEGFLFLGCFTAYLAQGVAVFPWKFYLFTAFSIPIALTLVFGLTLKVFDAHFFPDRQRNQAPELSRSSRLDLLFGISRQVPLLLWVFLLLVSIGLLYKMDDIALYLVQMGEAAARSVLLLLGIALGILSLLAVLWLVLNYRLRRRKIEQNHEYRMEVLQRTGLVLLEEGASPPAETDASDHAGIIVQQGSGEDRLPILPRLKR